MSSKDKKEEFLKQTFQIKAILLVIASKFVGLKQIGSFNISQYERPENKRQGQKTTNKIFENYLLNVL